VNVEIPLVLLLAVFGYFGIKLFRPPTWLVLTLLLAGFLLAGTFLGPAIEGTAETGVQVVNETND
jgi:hypothetical protein